MIQKSSKKHHKLKIVQFIWTFQVSKYFLQHFFEFQNDLKWSGVVEIMQVIECNCTCDCTFWYHHFLTIFHKIIDIHIANWIAINCYRNSMQWYNLDFRSIYFQESWGRIFFLKQKFHFQSQKRFFFDRNLKKFSPK